MIDLVHLHDRVVYRSNGIPHKPNGPAYVWFEVDGWSWWMYGKANRYYGPVSNYGNWTIHGKRIK